MSAQAQASSPLLQVEGVSKHFRGISALKQITFDVMEGSIVGLIGPNGAGKTTLFSIIAGAIQPDVGHIRFDGRDITGWPAHRVARVGIGRTFQLMRPFPRLTVLENVTISALSHTPHHGNAERIAASIVERVGLEHWAHQSAEVLSTAGRKRLEVAKALALRPKLLLLDEVMAGIVPAERLQMLDLLRAVRAEGVTLLLVEHVMSAVMALSDTVLVLHHGELMASGTPEVVVRNERVIEAYLGEESFHAST